MMQCLPPSKALHFLFDYGDDQHHGVKLVRMRDQVESEARYPRMEASHGEAPPQYPEMEDAWNEDDEDA
jgi:hypothetical protein